jgi:3-keto-L-gulonate-6-phosphate decarboxylase
MIGLASKFIGENDVDAKKLLESVKGLKLLIAETPNSKLKTDANTLIISGSYEELMKIKDGADNISIMVQESGEIIKDVIVMVDSPDEFVFINLTGNIDPQQVGKVLKTLNIKVDGLSTN